MNETTTQQTDTRATKILKGKVIHKLVWFQKGELLLQFSDGSALFVDSYQNQIELSYTEGPEEVVSTPKKKKGKVAGRKERAKNLK